MHIWFTGLQLKNVAVEKTDVVKPNRRWNMDFSHGLCVCGLIGLERKELKSLCHESNDQGIQVAHG